MNVTIIGTGYVGLTTGTALAYIGHEVTCVDKKPEIVERLAAGEPTIHEDGLRELLAAGKSRLRFRTDIPVLSGTGDVMIAVGTPSNSNDEPELCQFDTTSVELACMLC